MSKKVLLVYDDYAEMMRVQTDLMKIGFDVSGIVNEALLSDQLAAFYPDAVITSGQLGKVSALNVSQRLRETGRYSGKVIIVLPRSEVMSPDELLRLRADAVLESPAAIAKLIAALAKELQMDEPTLMAKHRRHKSDQKVKISRPRDRVSRFEAALNGASLPSRPGFFDRKLVREKQLELEKGKDSSDLAKIDEEKLRFAKALFRKGGNESG